MVAELIGGLTFPEEVLRLPLPAGANRLDGQVARLAVKGDAGAILLVETEVVQVVNLVPKPLINRVEAEELLMGIGLVELAGKDDVWAAPKGVEIPVEAAPEGIGDGIEGAR